jgi:SAM-dependent methyltransferase
MRMIDAEYASINLNKANFETIYRMPDPREYFRVLYGLDYVIPDLSKSIFRSLIEGCQRLRGKRLKVLDIGCSYGINPALIRFPVDIQRLANRYASTDMQAISPSRLANFDRHYFYSWPELVDADFIGADCSHAAVAYAQDVGLIEAGVSSDLERAAPDEVEAENLRGLDMIISTGCIGYVTEKSFARIFALQDHGRRPWVASFVLRMFSYQSIADELERHGLVTEKLEGVTFVQRRFHSEQEFEAMLTTLRARGLDPCGKEADGLLHAEFYLSRPKSDVRAIPLAELVSITSGANRKYGSRYRRVAPRDVKLMP